MRIDNPNIAILESKEDLTSLVELVKITFKIKQSRAQERVATSFGFSSYNALHQHIKHNPCAAIEHTFLIENMRHELESNHKILLDENIHAKFIEITSEPLERLLSLSDMSNFKRFCLLKSGQPSPLFEESVEVQYPEMTESAAKVGRKMFGKEPDYWSDDSELGFALSIVKITPPIRSSLDNLIVNYRNRTPGQFSPRFDKLSLLKEYKSLIIDTMCPRPLHVYVLPCMSSGNDDHPSSIFGKGNLSDILDSRYETKIGCETMPFELGVNEEDDDVSSLSYFYKLLDVHSDVVDLLSNGSLYDGDGGEDDSVAERVMSIPNFMFSSVETTTLNIHASHCRGEMPLYSTPDMPFITENFSYEGVLKEASGIVIGYVPLVRIGAQLSSKEKRGLREFYDQDGNKESFIVGDPVLAKDLYVDNEHSVLGELIGRYLNRNQGHRIELLNIKESTYIVFSKDTIHKPIGNDTKIFTEVFDLDYEVKEPIYHSSLCKITQTMAKYLGTKVYDCYADNREKLKNIINVHGEYTMYIDLKSEEEEECPAYEVFPYVFTYYLDDECISEQLPLEKCESATVIIGHYDPDSVRYVNIIGFDLQGNVVLDVNYYPTLESHYRPSMPSGSLPLSSRDVIINIKAKVRGKVDVFCLFGRSYFCDYSSDFFGFFDTKKEFDELKELRSDKHLLPFNIHHEFY
jgi:hypothetical protein